MSIKEDSSFYKLSIDQVFKVAESCGWLPTGEYFQLNSYENRVFDLFLEQQDQNPSHIISKVYRPHRWSLDAIKEEHDFLLELKAEGIPVIAPYVLNKNETTVVDKGMIFSFFPKALGRMPQELSLKDYSHLGKQIARLHNIGSQKKAKHRLTLDTETYGWASLDLLESWVAPEVWDRYEKAAVDILSFLEDRLEPENYIRIHGDCHKGNILQTDPKEGEKEIFFVDFDDFVMGPPVQDFWMFFSGDEEESSEELNSFLDGYQALRNFNEEDIDLIPALRGLRIIYYANWIAKRWKDPSFPKLFPEFKNYIYWAEEVEALEKIAWKL